MRKTQPKKDGINREDENCQVQLALAGNEKAMQAILARYMGQMYSIALKICKDPERAEDVRQEACLRVAQKLSQFSRTAALGGWIATITRNCAFQNLRQTQRRTERETSVDEIYEGSSDATPEAMVGDRQVLRLTDELLASLRDGDRELFELRYLDGLSIGEIAQRTGLSTAALKSRFHRARQHLREAYEVDNWSAVDEVAEAA